MALYMAEITGDVSSGDSSEEEDVVHYSRMKTLESPTPTEDQSTSSTIEEPYVMVRGISSLIVSYSVGVNNTGNVDGDFSQITIN